MRCTMEEDIKDTEKDKAKEEINRPKNILSTLDVIKILESDNDLAPVEEVEVIKRDINQKLVKIPEFDDAEFKKVVEKYGFDFNEFEGVLSYVFDGSIPNEEVYEREKKLEKLREEIKDAQLEFIEKDRQNIDIKSEIIDILSSTISRANKKYKIDKEKAFLIFKSILGSIVERRKDNLIFLDEEEINKIVTASLSDVPEEIKKNLESALIDTFIKIRKLFLMLAYDQLSIKVINCHLKEGELRKLQENKYISIEGAKLRVFSLSAYGKDCFIAVDTEYGDIVTFGLGKKRRTELDPIIHSIFIDRISFYIQSEFLYIISNAMERVKIELVLNMSKGLYLDFENYSIEELKSEKEELTNLSEILYRQIISLVNKTNAGNRDYTTTTLREKTRILRRVFGGGIKQEILSILPIDAINKSTEYLNKLNDSNQLFYDFMKNVGNNYAQAIEAKTKGNLEIVKKIVNNIKEKAIEYISDPENLIKMGKTALDYIKKKTGG